MKGAGFFKRVFSIIYDSLAITGIIFSLSLLLVLLNGGYAEENSIAGLIQLLIIILSGPCFYTYFWIANEGQTLGMQAWKIKLISQKKDLSIILCLLRLIFGAGYFLILFHKDNRSLADLLTDTQIIDLKKT